MDEDSLNIAVRKFLKVVGITSQREIERVVREGKIEGTKLKLRMTLTAENTPLNHVVEETIDLRWPVGVFADTRRIACGFSLQGRRDKIVTPSIIAGWGLIYVGPFHRAHR